MAGDILAHRARLSPDREALVDVATGRRFTYAELDRRAGDMARRWALAKGDRIGILSENRVEYIDAFFAAGRGGVVLVPLSTRLTVAELAVIVKDCGMRALLHSARYAGIAVQLRVDRRIDLDSLPLPVHAPLSADSPQPEDLYCLLYTSGTTGQPKGVMIPHRMVHFNAYNTAVSWQLREEDIAPIFTPLYHAGGLAVLLTPLFLLGGKILLHEHFDAAEVWRTIETERATIVFGVPTIFRLLLESPLFAAADLSAIRWCICGGAPLPQYIIDAFHQRGVVFKQGYGLTEAGVNCFAMSAEEAQRKAGSIGKPMLFTEARVAEDGELLLRGPHVMQGYWNQPEATRAALDGDSWLHTGDVARIDEEGLFSIAGRLKDMIISGGVNVYPAEIEAQLLQHAQVRDAAVVGVPDEKWGEAGVAFVVARAPLAADELAEFLRARIAKFKIPREFVILEELPRTPYGKVLKSELRQAWLDKEIK
jgi:fatty-acyl-CoA synthase